MRAYPTTIFLHGDGRLAAVHTGIAGPATGPAYAELRREFETIIEELLAAPQGGTGEPAAALHGKGWLSRARYRSSPRRADRFVCGLEEAMAKKPGPGTLSAIPQTTR